MTAMAECGTYAGAQQHRDRGTPPCADCRKATSEYMKRWRAANPKAAARHRARTALRDRARTILGQRHQAELWAIVSELQEQARLADINSLTDDELAPGDEFEYEPEEYYRHE